MPRVRRRYVSQESGLYHIISRVVGKQWLLGDIEKEYFFKLLKKFSGGFYIRVHAFCIMSNHFHILATCMDNESRFASIKELQDRYKLMYPNSPGYPEGSYDGNGELIEGGDDDGGIDRLRNRLGSVSCFMQELKQSFSRWYNKKHDRKGCFWSERFKSPIVSFDEAQLICSAYIDLNPVRAGIVEKPEDYRWNSLGLRVRSKREAAELLYPLNLYRTADGEINQTPNSRYTKKGHSLLIGDEKTVHDFPLYREFVYRTGAVSREGSAIISAEHLAEVEAYHGKLGVSDRLRYRVKNISEGIAFGSYELIESLQDLLKRKRIRPRSFMAEGKGDKTWSYSTRVLRP